VAIDRVGNVDIGFLEESLFSWVHKYSYHKTLIENWHSGIKAMTKRIKDPDKDLHAE